MTTFMTGLRQGTLYAGAASPLMGAMAHNAVLFFTLGQTQAFFRARYPDEIRPVRDAFAGGALVGVTASILETPVDLLKCKLQAAPQYGGVIGVGKEIVARHGVLALWQGFGATTLRNMPCFSMYFGCNVASKEYFRRPDGTISLPHQFVSGMAAGLGFWSFLYPLDVIKSRMQIQPTEKSKRTYSSVMHLVRSMLRDEGHKAFWRGYTPALIRSLVVNGSIFLAFEVAKEAMK